MRPGLSTQGRIVSTGTVRLYTPATSFLGEFWMIDMGGRILAGASGTVYLGPRGLHANPDKVAGLAPENIRVLRANFTADAQPGGTWTFRLQKSTVASGGFADAGMSVAMAGTSQAAQQDATVDFNRGDRYVWAVDKLNTPDADLTGSVGLDLVTQL